MIKINGYLVTLTSDSGVERTTNEGIDVVCDGYFCEVFDGNDICCENRIDWFCIAKGFEYVDETDESILNAIRYYFSTGNELADETDSVYSNGISLE